MNTKPIMFRQKQNHSEQSSKFIPSFISLNECLRQFTWKRHPHLLLKWKVLFAIKIMKALTFLAVFTVTSNSLPSQMYGIYFIPPTPLLQRHSTVWRDLRSLVALKTIMLTLTKKVAGCNLQMCYLFSIYFYSFKK
jgi:hypothetical protein